MEGGLNGLFENESLFEHGVNSRTSFWDGGTLAASFKNNLMFSGKWYFRLPAWGHYTLLEYVFCPSIQQRRGSTLPLNFSMIKGYSQQNKTL